MEARMIIVTLQEFAPCDDELSAYRKGEEWNEEKAQQLATQRVCIAV